MLQHSPENLDKQAEIIKIKAKLMDSYNLEPFEINKKNIFEPFRSR